MRKVWIIWVFPAASLRSAAGRYVPGSAIAPASSASPAVAAYGALHIANTGGTIPLLHSNTNNQYLS